MKPQHFYHVHSGHGHVASRWRPVVEEHFAALRSARFDGEVHVGIVGDLKNRFEVVDFLENEWHDGNWDVIAEADEGYEQVTLKAMHKFAKAAPAEQAILYMHTKGSYQDTPFNRAWRRSMTANLLELWPACVLALRNHDLVGCHWLPTDTAINNYRTTTPMFAGNFFWARAGYLASLAPVTGGDPARGYNRWGAEEWVGKNDPNVLDLKPGLPEYPQEDGGWDSVRGGQLHA